MARTDGRVMQELLKRVRAATGPDRKLDAELAWETGWRSPKRYVDDGAKAMAFLLQHGHPPAQAFLADEMGVPAFTASVDAAVALIERVLPGWGWDLVRPADGAPGRPRANVFKGSDLWGGEAAKPVLAILAATLTALIAQEATDA